jgi:hypothetical protein
MTNGDSELLSAWSFPLIGREKEYRLTAKLFRSKLVIEDRRGNKIAVKKRSRVIMVERWGKVDWFGE